MAGTRRRPQPGGRWQGWFMGHDRKLKFFTGTHRRAETLRMAQRFEDEHRQIRLGYRPVPKSPDRHKSRPFTEVVSEYLAWGKAQGGRGGRPWAARHAYYRQKALGWWKQRLGIETLADLDGVLPRVEEALRALKSEGLTRKTLQNYVEGLSAFCKWCIERGYLADDPLKGLASFDTTPKTTRRAMTPEETEKLLQCCDPKRRLLYEVALVSGLRRGELRSLRVGDLDAERGGLHLNAEWTKNRQSGFQPLPSDIAARLAEQSRGKAATDALLYMPYHPSCAFERDLKRAGIPKHAFGGKLDFHSLRVSYVSFVLQAGATVKEAQVLSRHSTPDLTVNVYGRARQDRLSTLAEVVGKMVSPHPEIAISLQKQAVGAETVRVTPLDGEELESAGDGGRCRSRTCIATTPNPLVLLH